MTFRYNSELKNLESLLQRKENVGLSETVSNGNFFYNDYLIEAYFQLEVIGFDYLSLPINDHQIELLLNQFSSCIVASKSNDIGKGRICEIHSSLIRIGGRLFDSEFQVIENVCKEKLGIDNDFEIATKLSKMVIYEKDCPTLPIVPTINYNSNNSNNSNNNNNSNSNNNNNSSSSSSNNSNSNNNNSNNSNNNNNNDINNNNTFGTLVLILPSTKSKGCDEFLIKHNNLVLSLNIPNVSPSNLRFFAFYNDCFNKMKSITNSFRVCLVYDLIKQPNSKRILSARQLDINKQKQLEYKKQFKALLEPLEIEFNLIFSKLEKLIYVLDHRYQSFSQILKSNYGNTKSTDKIVTEKILRLKKRLGYSIYLTDFVYEETLSQDQMYSSGSSSSDSSNISFQQNHQTSILSNFLDQNDLSPITLFGIEDDIDTCQLLPINCLDSIAPDQVIKDSIITKSYRASSLVIIKNKILPPLPSSPKKIISTNSNINYNNENNINYNDNDNDNNNNNSNYNNNMKNNINNDNNNDDNNNNNNSVITNKYKKSKIK